MNRKVCYISAERQRIPKRFNWTDFFTNLWPWVIVGILLWLLYLYADDIIIWIYNLSGGVNEMLGVS